MIYETAANQDGTPQVGEIRKAVRVTTRSGTGWGASYRYSLYWTMAAARAKHPRLTKLGNGSGNVSITASRSIRVVWDGEHWRLIGSIVKPK